MPFLNLPDFVVKQILTSTSLDQIIAALQGFSAQSADITWPLTAGDNLDMDDQYTIVGMRNLWNIINAGEYDLDTTGFQAAIDAAEAAGGGLVLIPPDTTISGTGWTINASKITIMGCGPSSIVQLSSGNGPIFTCGTSSYDDLQFINFAIDGNSAGSGVNAIKLQRNDRVLIQNMYIYSVVGDAIYITNDGTSGNSSIGVQIIDTRISGGSGGAHIKADDVQNLQIRGGESLSAGASSILIEPDAAAALTQDIQIGPYIIDGVTGKGISILGGSGTASTKWSQIHVHDVVVNSPTGVGIELGTTSKILQEIDLDSCDVWDAGDDAFNVNASTGSIANCNGLAATVDGIDLIDSDEVVVRGNNFRGAGAYGINADGTTSCSIHSNDVTGAATQGILLTNATTPILGSNQGAPGPTLNTVISDYPHEQRTTSGTYSTTYTIPANSLKIGDHLRITAYFDITGYTSGNVIPTIRLDANNLGGTTTTAVGLIKTVVDIHINALSGASNLSHSTHSIYAPNAAGAVNGYALTQTLTVDLTSDVDVSASVAIGVATVYFEEVLIEWLGGNE